MVKFKKDFKKYFILLVSFYLGIRILAVILFNIYPDILTFDISEGVSRSFSKNYLIKLLTYLTNIVFVVLIFNDLKKVNIKSFALLVVTFFSNIVGVLFYFILLFAIDLYNNRNEYETNN